MIKLIRLTNDYVMFAIENVKYCIGEKEFQDKANEAVWPAADCWDRIKRIIRSDKNGIQNWMAQFKTN